MLLDYSAIEDESHAYYFDDEDDMYRSQANFCPTTGSYNIAQQQAQYPGSDFYYTEPRTSQEQLMSTSTWTPTPSSTRGMTDWQGQVTMGSYINPMDQQTNSVAQYSESDNYSGLCAVAQAINRTPTMSYHHQWMRSSTYRFNPSTGKTRTKDKYRVVYTDHQRLELEKEFRFSRYITIRRKSELATSLGLSERQVKIWFQNRRAKDRKQAKKQGVQLDETEGPKQTNQRTGFIEGVEDYSNQKELMRNIPASYRITDQPATVLIKEEPISSQSQTSCLKSL